MRERLAASKLSFLFAIAMGAGCRAYPAALHASPPPRAAGPERLAEAPAPAQASPASAGPGEARLRGELVCLLEEVQRRYGVAVAPVHAHLSGLKAEDGALYTILRTPTSAFLFTDPRFAKKTLAVTGRTFPRSGLLEVTRADWVRDGKVYEVYYWCEVCSIRGMDPGPCSCCRGPVELRERPVGGGPATRVPDSEPKELKSANQEP